MALLDFLLPSQQPQGGLVGRLSNLQVPVQNNKNSIIADPDFSRSLMRLGANLMSAGSQTDNTLGAIGNALGATLDQTNNDALQRAQIDAYRAKASPEQQGPAQPFGGTGYQNQIMSSRYQYHLARGDDPLTAQQKAINDFYSLNPVTGVDAEGRPYTMPRASLSYDLGSGAQQGMMQDLPQGGIPQPDAIEKTAQSLGLRSDMLLPPPSGQGAPDMSLFQGNQPVATQPLAAPMDIGVPSLGGPKTQQALNEAAGKAEIEVQGEFAKQLGDIEAKRLSGYREAASNTNRLAPDMERLALAIDRYGQTGTFGEMRLELNKIGATLGLANPEKVAEGEIIKQLVSKITPTMRPAGSGAASDADMRLFKDSLSNLMTTPQGAAKAFAYFKRIQDFQNNLAQEAENYAYNNRSMRGFDKYLKALEDSGQVSLWTPKERAELEAISKGRGAATAGMPQPNNKQEFDALPSGTQFIDPNGVVRRKP